MRGQVVTTEQCTPAVLKARPKDPKAVPVRFFPTVEYIWASPKDVHCLLDKETIDQQLERNFGKAQDLKKGYEILKNPPSLEDLVWRDALPQMEEDEEEEEEQEEEDEEEEEEGEYGEEAGEGATKAGQKRKSASGGTKKLATNKKAKVEAANGTPNKSVSKIKLKSKAVAGPTAEEKAASRQKELHEIRKKEVLYLRHKLQKAFRLNSREGDKESSPPKDEEMPAIQENIAKLEKLEGLDPDILKVIAPNTLFFLASTN